MTTQTVTLDGTTYDVVRSFGTRAIIQYDGLYVFADFDGKTWRLTPPGTVTDPEQISAMTGLVQDSGTLDTTVTTIEKA